MTTTKANWGLLLFLLIPTAWAAGTHSSSFTWHNVASEYHELQVWATRCMPFPASQDLNVTVLARPGSGVDADATVTATVYKPLGGTDSISFASNGDGNYSKTYSFDQNGTYKLSIHSTNADFSPGDLNEYVYVGDFSFLVSFVNNGFSVAAGATGTIQNLVINSDNNAVTGLSGSLDINYPNGSAFVNDGVISETGSGYYYHNFTAPNTNGLYTVQSFFACQTHTDSNSQGKFTVTGATASAGTTGGSGSGGSGGSGSGGDGTVPETSSKKPFAASVSDWGFSGPLEANSENPLQVTIKNTGANASAFLLKISVLQAEELEFFYTQLTPFILPGKSIEIAIDEPVVPKYGGSHSLRIEIFLADGSEKIGTFGASFDAGGVLRYDVSVTCLDEQIQQGQSEHASITLINLGDFFQDIQLQWWVQPPSGEQMASGTLPLALYRNETRNLLRSTFIPSDAKPGAYLFVARLSYYDVNQEGRCTFIVNEKKEPLTEINPVAGELFAGLSASQMQSVALSGLLAALLFLIVGVQHKIRHGLNRMEKTAWHKTENTVPAPGKKESKAHEFLEKLFGLKKPKV